jgi:hypothetical protein
MSREDIMLQINFKTIRQFVSSGNATELDRLYKGQLVDLNVAGDYGLIRYAYWTGKRWQIVRDWQPANRIASYREWTAQHGSREIENAQWKGR